MLLKEDADTIIVKNKALTLKVLTFCAFHNCATKTYFDFYGDKSLNT